MFDFRPKPYVGVETARHIRLLVIAGANVKNPRVLGSGAKKIVDERDLGRSETWRFKWVRFSQSIF
jgi:hypothetical protein